MAEERKEVQRKDISFKNTVTLTQVKAKEKRRMTERRTVNDLSTSVSSWTLPMMCKYIDFNRDVARWSEDPKGVFFESVEEVISKGMELYKLEQVLFKKYLRKIKLNQPEWSNPIDMVSHFTESEVKSLLSIVVYELAKIWGLMITEEQTIPLQCYPTCRLDYVLWFADKPVGCVEAKTNATFTQKAFAQAVIQLVVFQQWAFKYGRHFGLDLNRVPLFNILTNGRWFIFLKLRENTLYVEKTWEGVHKRRKPRSHIKIRKISGKKVFCAVFRYLCALCVDAMSALKQSALTQDDSTDKEIKEDEISLDPVSNEDDWKQFLTPLASHTSRKVRQPQVEQKIPICTDNIEGPMSLSKKFGIKLADTFITETEEG